MSKSRKIKLDNGKETIVDVEDYEYLKQFQWTENKNGDVVRYVIDESGRKLEIRMDYEVLRRAGKI